MIFSTPPAEAEREREQELQTCPAWTYFPVSNKQSIKIPECITSTEFRTTTGETRSRCNVSEGCCTIVHAVNNGQGGPNLHVQFWLQSRAILPTVRGTRMNY